MFAVAALTRFAASVLGLFIASWLGSSGGGVPVSVQECNTRCQSEQTECVLRCDGDIPCIHGCQTSADACVAKCLPAPPAPSGSAAPSAPR